ncbi:MAG: hypothetical protein JOZ13_02270 [Alphaproteobacteria bacterium]|nr:hypothetical protein [Alphaproteobacteria bacterium]
MVAETISRAGAAPSFRIDWPPVRRELIGLLLVATFAATGAVLLLLVTAIQFQNALEAPEFTSLQISTGWIRQDVSYLENYWQERSAIKNKLAEAEAQKFAVGQRGAKIRADMSRTAEVTRNFIDLNDTAYILPPLKLHAFPTPSSPPPLPAIEEGRGASQLQRSSNNPQDTSASQAPAEGAASNPSPAAATKYQVAIPPPISYGFGNTVDDYFDAYYAELAGSQNADAARKSLNTFKVETYKRMEPYFAARAQFEADSSQIRGLNVEIAALESQAKQLDDKSQAKGTALADGAYWSLTEDFMTFKSLVGETAYNIIALPRMMLVLLLSIFMGILGSLIYITRDFQQDPDRRGFWGIVFRIGLGAGVAFALFFFAAAGMLAMAQTKSGAQSDMSPYLIAFLGITGGYLSDRVTQWMREMGESAFKIKGDGPPDRWAVGLAEGLKASGLDGVALASSAGVTAADADAWVALTKPVPGDKQGLVAAFLREHPSRVFTDIAPG